MRNAQIAMTSCSIKAPSWRTHGKISEEKLEGVQIVMNPEDPLDIQAVVEGPAQTPYEGQP